MYNNFEVKTNLWQDGKSDYDEDSFKLEYWQSQEGSRWVFCKFARAMLNFFKSRSKFTVKVTCLKSMTLSYWKSQDIRNTYGNYKLPISYCEKVISNVQK